MNEATDLMENLLNVDSEFMQPEWEEAEIRRGRRGHPSRPRHPIDRQRRIAPPSRRPGRSAALPRRPRPPRQATIRPRRSRYIHREPLVAVGAEPCTCPAQDCPQHGSEYVRWVQSSLNRIQELNLPINGIMDAAARSALRRFQEQQGLTVDGIAGPETKQALMSSKNDTADHNEGASESETVDLFSLDNEMLESEINRSSRGYIRWVQQALNTILGLRLAVDGIIGNQTRSAIRDFQKQKGLAVDGIVGKQTEAALIAAGAGQPRETQVQQKLWIERLCRVIEDTGTLQGFSTFAIAAAYTESRWHLSAHKQTSSEVQSSCRLYKGARSRGFYADNPYSESDWCIGSGGWFGLMPATGLAAGGTKGPFIQSNPRLIFQPVESVVMLADLVRRLVKNYGADSWLAVRRGMASPGLVSDRTETKERSRAVRRRFEEALQKAGLPASFMFEKPNLGRYPGAAELLRIVRGSVAASLRGGIEAKAALETLFDADPYLEAELPALFKRNISASVGASGVNNAEDVRSVQLLLNTFILAGRLPDQNILTVDGLIGSRTINAIKSFQRRFVGLGNPDGRVDPGGRTLEKLNGSILQPVVISSSMPSSPSGGSSLRYGVPGGNIPNRNTQQFLAERSGGRIHFGIDVSQSRSGSGGANDPRRGLEVFFTPKEKIRIADLKSAQAAMSKEGPFENRIQIDGTGDAWLQGATVTRAFSHTKPDNSYGGWVGLACHYGYVKSSGKTGVFTIHTEYLHLITLEALPYTGQGSKISLSEWNNAGKRHRVGFGPRIKQGATFSISDILSRPPILIGFLGTTRWPHVHIQAAFKLEPVVRAFTFPRIDPEAVLR